MNSEVPENCDYAANSKERELETCIKNYASVVDALDSRLHRLDEALTRLYGPVPTEPTAAASPEVEDCALDRFRCNNMRLEDLDAWLSNLVNRLEKVV